MEIFNTSYEDYGTLFTRLSDGTLDTWPAKKELESILGARLWRDQHSYRRIRTHKYTDTTEAMGLFKAQHPGISTIIELPVYDFKFRGTKVCDKCGPQHTEFQTRNVLYSDIRLYIEDPEGWLQKALGASGSISYDI